MAALTFTAALEAPSPVLAAACAFGRRFAAILAPEAPELEAHLQRHFTFSISLSSPPQNIAVVSFIPDPTIWDTDNRPWGAADFAYSEAKPIMIIGSEFFQAEEGASAGGNPVRVSLVRTGLTIFGRDQHGKPKVDPGMIKFVSGLWPSIKGLPGTVVKLYVGAQETPDSPILWEGPYDFVVGTSYFQDFTVSGRYIAVRFESIGQEVWELSGYDLDIDPIGGR